MRSGLVSLYIFVYLLPANQAHPSSRIKANLLVLRRLDRRTEQVVAWLDARYLGSVLRIVFGLVIAGLPTAQSFDLITSKWWLLPFFGCAILLIPLHHYHNGSPLTRVTRQLAEVNGAFAGTIELLRQKLSGPKTRKLDNSQCELLCVALLHRIRDYTAIALNVTDKPKLRATLSVPVATGSGSIDALRVWCYDRPPERHGYTTLPLRHAGEVVPGSPAAYESGDMQIIVDLHALPALHSAAERKRPYRSIVSIPVPARGADGRPLAVVNLDADEPDFFQPEAVLRSVRPFIAPAVNAIGLVLLLRKGGDYVFPR